MANETIGTASEEKLAQTSLIAPPNMREATFVVKGTAPLVIHRFSAKVKQEMAEKMKEGKSSGSKKKREPKNFDDAYRAARYQSSDGWDGFHAAAVRNAMISACRLVGFKMTLAKLSIFVIADGWDRAEPQIPLVKIDGEPVMQEDMARVETGQPYVTVRAAYHQWSARIKIRWDFDQFSEGDVLNLLARVGVQVGIGEGRPDSKNSAGMGWGLFDVVEVIPIPKTLRA
jgi:hypothetical protein